MVLRRVFSNDLAHRPSDETHSNRTRRTTYVKDHPALAARLATVAEFLKVLTASDLMTPAELETLKAGLKPDSLAQDGSTLAQTLIEQGFLTNYQANELLSGSSTPLVYGDYVIMEKLGAGGMATVYRAYDRMNGHVIALKVVTERDERFDLEVRAAAKVCHPNVVQVYDRGEAHGCEYLVMELVDGPVLSQHVQEHGPMSVPDAVDAVLQTAHGVAHVHLQRIVHRDLKPQNLLRDSEGRVKILDFGLARFDIRPVSYSDGTTLEEKLTTAGTILGTPSYTSPEQIRDSRTAGFQADIYSLGCTLYYLLAGSPPYTHFNPMKIIESHLKDPIPSIRETRKDVSEELDALIQRMLAKDPADRHETVEDLIKDLEKPEMIAPPPVEDPKAKKRKAKAAAKVASPAGRRWGRDLVILAMGLMVGGAIGLAAWLMR